MTLGSMQCLGYRIYITVELLVTIFTEDYCIWDSGYVENISLRELQPPELRTICYVLPLFESLLHLLYNITLLSFFPPFFLSSLFFSFFPVFFSLRCLLMITIFQFYFPFVLTIFFSFFFSSQNFSSSIFSTFQTYVSQHFFLTQLIFYLLGLFQYNFHLIL